MCFFMLINWCVFDIKLLRIVFGSSNYLLYYQSWLGTKKLFLKLPILKKKHLPSVPKM